MFTIPKMRVLQILEEMQQQMTSCKTFCLPHPVDTTCHVSMRGSTRFSKRSTESFESLCDLSQVLGELYHILLGIHVMFQPSEPGNLWYQCGHLYNEEATNRDPKKKVFIIFPKNMPVLGYMLEFRLYTVGSKKPKTLCRPRHPQTYSVYHVA